MKSWNERHWYVIFLAESLVYTFTSKLTPENYCTAELKWSPCMKGFMTRQATHPVYYCTFDKLKVIIRTNNLLNYEEIRYNTNEMKGAICMYLAKGTSIFLIHLRLYAME